MKPIACLSSMATKKLLGDLAGLYESRTGRPVAVHAIGGVHAAAQVRAGDVLDIVVLAGAVMQDMETEGLLVPGSLVPLAVSRTAFAVPAGADRPDLSTLDALRRALLAVPSIAYSTGPSGDHFLALLERQGLSSTLAPKLVKAPPGVPVGSLVASGQAALGFQQYSELFEIPGIAVISDIAPETRAATVFTGGVARTCGEPSAAADVLSFMASSEAAPVCRRCGLAPPRGA